MKTRSAIAILTLAATALAQKPKLVAPDPDLPEQLKTLSSAVKDRKMARDNEAVGLIDTLAGKREAGMHEKDAKKVLIAISKVFVTGRLRDPKAAQVYRAAAVALGRFGPPAARVITKTYDNKSRFPKRETWVPLRVLLLESLGKTKDERSVKFLTDEATRANSHALMAAAGGALGNYQQSPLKKVRKPIVKEMLKKFGELEAAKDTNFINIPGRPQNFAGSNAKEALLAIKPKWLATLRKLTRQDFKEYEVWERWHNKNKNKDWDKR